jgi:hypothetical protein
MLITNSRTLCGHFRSIWTIAHDQCKGLQRCGPRMKPKSHISCSWECGRMWGNEPHTPKWTFTLGIGV